RDDSDIFNLWDFLLRIESCDLPILIRLFLSAQHVERSFSKSVTADFGTDINLTDNGSVRVELQYAMLVPLAEIKIPPVEAQIRSSKFRTREHLRKSSLRRVAINVSIVIRTFADGKTHFTVRRDCCPWNAGRFFLFAQCPILWVNSINSAQIAGTHP